LEHVQKWWSSWYSCPASIEVAHYILFKMWMWYILLDKWSNIVCSCRGPPMKKKSKAQNMFSNQWRTVL
jgi:hypothetical protein